MKILVCGDFTTCGKGLNSVRNGTAIDEDIVALIKGADVSIVNLECPVADENDIKILKSGPHLRTEVDTISYLKECGFSHVTLANNHFCDYAENGVKKTIYALERKGIEFVGGGRTTDEIHKHLYIEHDGIKIAILNYCENEFSTHGVMGSNPMNPISVYYDIQKAKEKCEYVVVICHGGHEGYNLPSPRMKKLYRFFIDVGADIICNHHQHCFSGCEEYKGGMIYYGLGNFFFDDFRPKRQQSVIWNFGYMVQLIIKNGSLTSKIFPYCQCLNNASVYLLKEDELLNFKTVFQELSVIIADERKLKESFNMWCRNQKMYFLTCFSPYSNKYLMALCRRGLLPKFLSNTKKLDIYNKIRCESHRDVVIESLKP